MVTLRPATPADADRVAEVWASAWWDGHRGHIPEQLVAARGPAYFAARTAELLDRVTVAEADGVLLGVVIVVDDELQQLMVSSAARGTGVGGLLIDAAERQVAAGGHAEIWLSVVPGNATARAFYERRGWVDDGPATYDSKTLTEETVPVPVRRYAKRL